MATNVRNSAGVRRRYHYLYEVQFGKKKILRPESMTFVIGRSRTADLVIDCEKVAGKQCEIICCEGSWKLRNLSSKGTSIIGRALVLETEEIKEGGMLKIGGIYLQLTTTVVEEEYLHRKLTIIGLIGEKFCSMVAESQTLSDECPQQFEPKGVSDIDNKTGKKEAEDIVSKEAMQNLSAENEQLMQDLLETKSALRKALIEKGEAELTVAQRDEQLISIQEKTEIPQSVAEAMESELLCSVCNDMLVKAITLNCSHTFCEACLEQWKKKNKICPVCRCRILHQCHSRTIDSFIERILPHLPEDIQQRRKEVLDLKKAPKKRTKRSSSGRSKRKRISVIELGSPVDEMNEIVRLSFDFADPQNETIEIISSDDEVYL
ncbi:E3 ubiquitin-protein ligase rnf8-B-like [Ischnura elegans]|uniref:E3 ubiquitin-protein ligase rnf8-B-like n=1 Tax=Ischnura elegans TaxID=197161 RepID=UPI001ED86DAA|nr:E3 ubiquitin-protein ligase rnf8-B-like [Ischnura elegans]